MRKNAKVSKIDKKETILKKFFYKKMLYILYIFWENVLKWKYIKCWSIKWTLMYPCLWRSFYFKHIASRIFRFQSFSCHFPWVANWTLNFCITSFFWEAWRWKICKQKVKRATKSSLKKTLRKKRKIWLERQVLCWNM